MAEEQLRDIQTNDSKAPEGSVKLSSNTLRETAGVENGGSECRIGNTTISSYCCIVLVIFAFLFILIGSVLIFATSRYSDEEVVRFLSRHKYLKYASPLMFTLGVLMLISGVIYWTLRHFTRNRLGRRSKSFSTSAATYCSSDAADAGVSSRNSLAVLRSRNSLGSASSSRNASPLLRPSSVGETANEDWKWSASQTKALSPVASFPQLSTDSISVSCNAEFPMKEQCVMQRCSSNPSLGSNELSRVVHVECEPIHE